MITEIGGVLIWSWSVLAGVSGRVVFGWEDRLVVPGTTHCHQPHTSHTLPSHTFPSHTSLLKCPAFTNCTPLPSQTSYFTHPPFTNSLHKPHTSHTLPSPTPFTNLILHTPSLHQLPSRTSYFTHPPFTNLILHTPSLTLHTRHQRHIQQSSLHQPQTSHTLPSRTSYFTHLPSHFTHVTNDTFNNPPFTTLTLHTSSLHQPHILPSPIIHTLPSLTSHTNTLSTYHNHCTNISHPPQVHRVELVSPDQEEEGEEEGEEGERSLVALTGVPSVEGQSTWLRR